MMQVSLLKEDQQAAMRLLCGMKVVDKFTLGTTTGTADSTGNITITTGTLVASMKVH